MMRFEGKVAIVTGASLLDGGVGIGGATAISLAAEGARVVVADLASEGGGNRLAEKIQADGGQATPCALDQSREDSVIALVDLAVKTYGTIDVLVNNAATVPLEDTDAINTTVQMWDMVMGVNARGAFMMTKYVLPHMLKAGSGSIVNVSSGSALVGDVTRIAYGASKGAINTLTKYVATLYGKRGIRCNAICPGLTLSAHAKRELPEPVLDIFRKHTLTPYLGDPVYLANVIKFLASDEAAFVTGIIMSVDGGLLQHQTYSADLEAFAAAQQPS